MTMHTSARDEALLEEIAQYFDTLASDSEAFAQRGLGSKRDNLTRAACWRQAAEDIRGIRLDLVQP
jgi:hypothetical protein